MARQVKPRKPGDCTAPAPPFSPSSQQTAESTENPRAATPLAVQPSRSRNRFLHSASANGLRPGIAHADNTIMHSFAG